MASSPASSANIPFMDAELVSSIVEIGFHGFYSCVFFATMYNCFFNNKARSRDNNKFVIGATIVSYILSTAHIAVRADSMRQAFVFHASTGATITQYLSTTSVPRRVGGAVIFSTNTLVADCMFIWRCWMVWGRDWRVVVAPILFTIVGTAFAIFGAVVQGLQTTLVNPSAKLVSSGIPYFSFSLATVVVSTVLITFRILSMAKFTALATDASSKGARIDKLYTRAVEIVIESASLYTITLMIYLVIFARSDIRYLYLQNILAQVSGLAPCLIVLRVSLGLARPASEWTTSRRGNVSTVNFVRQTTGFSSANPDTLRESNDEEKGSEQNSGTDSRW